MSDLRFSLSSYINDSLIKRRTNFLMERLIHLFFMRMDFDGESLLTLKDCAQQGRIVYASFQNSVTSLLILMNALRRHDLPVPHLALDFSLYSLQIISNLFKRMFRFFSRLTQKIEHEPIGDQQYMEQVLRENKGIIFSLLSGKMFKRRYIDIEEDPIQHLVEIQRRVQMPIFIVPQISFWNHNPERTKALLTPSATGDRSLISAVSTVARSATPAFIRIASPVNLMDEIAEFPDETSREVARRVRGKLLESYSFEKRSVLGPVIKTRQEMMEKVLYHTNVLDTIQQVTDEEKTSEKRLRKKAYGYFREIAADFSILYINYFYKSVQVMFRRIFDGFHYDIEDFKRIREASQAGPLIYVPSHRSHMDYLILSSMCYENKIIPPHIVAGSNLLFFPMGKVFRRSGAFFMRRSFKGLKLYGTIFRQYVKTLINEGYSIEFFIEGGRSRTGKLVYPKMGILKYLIESIDEGYNRDMVFVPLSINYDRILEETSYLGEIKGKEKKKESTSAFVQSRKLLRRRYGSVYLSFNEPVSYQTLRQQYPEGDPTEEIGMYLARKINEVVQVTPFSLVTTALLLSVSRGFTTETLKERVRQLYDYLASCGVPMTPSLKDGEFDSIIEYVISSYQNDDIVREIEQEGQGEPSGLYAVGEESRPRINLYKNNIVHYLLPLSYASVSLMALGANDSARMKGLRDTFSDIMELLRDEFVYTSAMEDAAAALDGALAYFEACGIVTLQGESVQITRQDDLRFYARGVQDFLESYQIVYRTIAESGGKRSRREMMSEIRKQGITMFHLGDVALSESLSMPTYQSAFAHAVSAGILTEQRFGKRNIDVRVEDPERARETLQRIGKYLQAIR
ncbi:MAG: 1-acyl-sn-glycerol-3-phosphate acyltransferase [Spirochaetes bacterium]|nr:1-acyl-sn-glycerol-3-phosphate acyltransferase [Spirochaetota bacterium]